MSDTTILQSGAANPSFSEIKDIIADIREGKMVIMVDDENRENEGDLLMAASKVQPEHINYMATHGRGLICLTISRERCAQLRLPLMVKETDQHHSTNFTLSIEAAEGITTGISAHDRARTVQAAVAPDAKAEDIRQPGHIFPVMAQPGGVLIARRPHRSWLRSCEAGRSRTRCCHRRNSQGRWQHGAPTGPREICTRA